jgi:hypothetical protein
MIEEEGLGYLWPSISMQWSCGARGPSQVTPYALKVYTIQVRLTRQPEERARTSVGDGAGGL